MYLSQTYKTAGKVLKYKANHKYFGELTGAQLTAAKQKLYTDEYDIRTEIPVGEIDGNVICNALWQQMSYNPDRFGTVSPFVINGKNDIYRFVRSDIRMPRLDYQTLQKIQGMLLRYLYANARPNGQWNDKIETDNGRVVLTDVSSQVCRALTVLQDCVYRIIAPQNMADFKIKQFKDNITSAVMAAHPELFNGRCGL